jgi:hypothetical protein
LNKDSVQILEDGVKILLRLDNKIN